MGWVEGLHSIMALVEEASAGVVGATVFFVFGIIFIFLAWFGLGWDEGILMSP